MPHPDGRRCSWADGYCNRKLIYLGPFDEGAKRMDLFFADEYDGLAYAMPVVAAHPLHPDRPAKTDCGYAHSSCELESDEKPDDLEFGTANGNSNEHVRLAVNVAVRRARARGLMGGA